MRERASAPDGVPGLLCVMSFITFLDRVDVATAGAAIIRDLDMSSTRFGLIRSALAYPCAIFQAVGGAVGDRFGAPR